MSQNQNDERPQDAAETTDETQLDATPTTDETPVVDAGEGDTQVLEPEAGDTQVLEPDARDTQILEPGAADPDEPLSVFDQPSGTAADTTSAGAAYTAASYGAAPAGTPGVGYTPYAAGGYQTPPPSYTTPPSSYTGATASSSPYGGSTTPPSPYTGAAYEPMTWTAPPKPLVKTTPRTGTIVWGFIILAIGIGAISVAAGATLDVTLAMIWLLAAAGAVLVVASIVGAARRRSRVEGSDRA